MANAQIDVQFIENRKGGQNLAFESFIYLVKQCKGDGKIFWQSAVPGCSASLSTQNNIPTGFGRRQHTHRADHTFIVAKQIMTKVKKRCLEEVRDDADLTTLTQP